MYGVNSIRPSVSPCGTPFINTSYLTSEQEGCGCMIHRRQKYSECYRADQENRDGDITGAFLKILKTFNSGVL